MCVTCRCGRDLRYALAPATATAPAGSSTVRQWLKTSLMEPLMAALSTSKMPAQQPAGESRARDWDWDSGTRLGLWDSEIETGTLGLGLGDWDWDRDWLTFYHYVLQLISDQHGTGSVQFSSVALQGNLRYGAVDLTQPAEGGSRSESLEGPRRQRAPLRCDCTPPVYPRRLCVCRIPSSGSP